ncbi:MULTISPECIES: DUF411 domain-containing protein [Gilvimarinus]|uniref:DUF411 domain-containing protein n=1 Tax=Gilvimarinus TaxID=940550 RepID=UPI000368CD1B|nr:MULTISPECIES: DUF411 domain-containing protein [Gilvimarinus]UTF61242.1 DUF411 domain-containing protein [Gilvimarinus sp. DA14]
MRKILLFITSLMFAACTEHSADDASQSMPSTEEDLASPIALTVYKTPTCGCCGLWVDHMKNAGFSTTVYDQENLNPIKYKHKIMPANQSCHTGIIEGYVFEGHIPATVVKRFLKEKPENTIGLTVPGMPLGSPGMEVNGQFHEYDVLLMKEDGSTSVYAHIDRPE